MTDYNIPRFHTCIECESTKLIAEFGFQTGNGQPFNQCKTCKAGIRSGARLPRLKASTGLCPLAGKRCSVCKTIKPIDEFYWRPQRGTREARCRLCRSAAQRKYSATERAREARKIVTARLKQRPDWKIRQRKWQTRYRSGPKHKARMSDPLYREAQKRAMLSSHLRSNFGITIEEYEAIAKMQNGLCAICRNPPMHRKRLSVDHDHATGAIRGLLCQLCNYALGHFKDSITTMESAIKYLRQHRQLKLVV